MNKKDSTVHDAGAQIKALREQGVKRVRVNYSDMHGTARGKDVPLDVFEQIPTSRDGLSFCIANLTDGLAGNPTYAPGLAPDRGFPDMLVKPVLSILVQIPWEPETAWCIGNVEDVAGGGSLASRSLLVRALELYRALELTPVIGPELEFFLLRQDETGRLTRYLDRHSMVYTTGQRSDPEGVVRHMLQAAHDMGLQATSAFHETSRSQYEINLLHGEALPTADRTFLFKALVKEIAARYGLLATFMGKPLNDDGGSGFHLHISLFDRNGDNAFAAPASKDRLSELARHFLAGVLEHAAGMMAFCAPTINSYKRLVPNSLVPTAVNWAYNNRTTFVRVPADGGKATRLELRAADGAANPYLVTAVSLLAGLDGIRRELEPSEPVSGDASTGVPVGPRLPLTLGASLSALQADQFLCEAIGAPLVNAYCAMKSVEAERFRTYITDWEVNEYVWHL